MKTLTLTLNLTLNLFLFLLTFLSASFCFKALSFDDEIVFQIREGVKELERKQKEIDKPKALEFRRQSFSYSDDFVILNKEPKAPLKSGTVLKVDFIFPIPEITSEEIEVIALVISPIKAGLFGKIKAVKNTNQAKLVFHDIVYNEKVYSIETFPVFLKGRLQASFFKELAFDFLESIPVFLAFTASSHKSLRHFINKDLKDKTKELSDKEKRKLHNQNKKIKALKINHMKIIKVIVK